MTDLDKLIHEPARLRVLTILSGSLWQVFQNILAFYPSSCDKENTNASIIAE